MIILHNYSLLIYDKFVAYKENGRQNFSTKFIVYFRFMKDVNKCQYLSEVVIVLLALGYTQSSFTVHNRILYALEGRHSIRCLFKYP
jgi:hypothetical protein